MRWPVMQRGKKNARQRHDQRAKADDDAIDPGVEPQSKLAQLCLDCGDVSFGSEVLVDRIEDFRGNPLGRLSVDIRIRRGVR